MLKIDTKSSKFYGEIHMMNQEINKEQKRNKIIKKCIAKANYNREQPCVDTAIGAAYMLGVINCLGWLNIIKEDELKYFERLEVGDVIDNA